MKIRSERRGITIGRATAAGKVEKVTAKAEQKSYRYQIGSARTQKEKTFRKRDPKVVELPKPLKQVLVTALRLQKHLVG